MMLSACPTSATSVTLLRKRVLFHRPLFFIIILALAFFGCGQKVIAPSPDVTKQKVLFDDGTKALNKKNYSLANKKFSELLERYPTTPWLAGAYYNMGLAEEGLGHFGEAIEKYKKVVDLYRGAPSRDEADALYRMSICYETLSDDTKMILALLSLQNQTSFLSKDVAEVELPARLAAAYSRQGNSEQGRFYYHKAEVGLKRLRRARLTGDILIWLPKTFYSMGHIPDLKTNSTHEEFKNDLAALEQAQSWLLKAGELNDKVWAKKAVNELQSHYDQAWAAIDQMTPAEQGPNSTAVLDKMQALKDLQERQRARAAELDATISHLKLERLPSSPSEPEPQIVTAMFNHIDDLQRRIDLLMQSPSVQDQDSPEAQQKEGLRREGQILGPNK